MANKPALCGLLATIAIATACGGGGIAGPNTVLGYAGTYSGVMTYANDHATTNAQTTVSQSGSTLNLAALSVSVPADTTFDLGNATVTGADFSGTSSYGTRSCGTASSNYQGRFSGNQMHLEVTLVAISPPPGVACPRIDLEGDLSKP